MPSPPGLESLPPEDLAAAAGLAAAIQVVRSLQALGSDTPSPHAIYITLDLTAPGVTFPTATPDPTAATATIVLQHQYRDLRVDWDGISVVLLLRGRLTPLHIPFGAILSMWDHGAGWRTDTPQCRRDLAFQTAFRQSAATVMMLHLASQLTFPELEARAMFSLLPALLAAMSSIPGREATYVVTFDTAGPGVSLPPSLSTPEAGHLTFTVEPGASDVDVNTDGLTIELAGLGDGSQVFVPMAAIRAIAVPAQSLVMPVAPCYVPVPPQAFQQRAHGEGVEFEGLGTTVPASRFPPGSYVEAIWDAGKLCLTGYVGRHSIPDLKFTDDLRHRVPMGAENALEIVIFEDFAPNAIAFKEGSDYYVGIYHGLVLSIPDFAIARWTRPDVADWVGDIARLPPRQDRSAAVPAGLEMLEFRRLVDREDTDAVELERYVDDAHERGLRYQKLMAAMDPVRRMALQQSVEDAFRYIWLHEIGHVVWGHVDLFEEATGALYISEADDAAQAAFPPEFGHFLEFQADRFAVTGVLEGRTIDRSSDPQASIGRGFASYVDQATIAIMGCMLAQLVLAVNLRLQGRADVSRTHPPLWFRARDMINQAYERYASLDPTDGTDAEVLAQTLNARLHRVISSVVGTHPLLQDIFDTFAASDSGSHDAYLDAFEHSVPKWDAIVRPYFKYVRRPDGGIGFKS